MTTIHLRLLPSLSSSLQISPRPRGIRLKQEQQTREDYFCAAAVGEAVRGGEGGFFAHAVSGARIPLQRRLQPLPPPQPQKRHLEHPELQTNCFKDAEAVIAQLRLRFPLKDRARIRMFVQPATDMNTDAEDIILVCLKPRRCKKQFKEIRPG